MYKIVFTVTSEKRLGKLERRVRERILKKLMDIEEDPRRYLKGLTRINAYRLRIGKYRIIMDVDENKKIINVLALGIRKQMYKR
ncbi:MAG: type II toxin-antitoxin system RelE/ParE family toxin [Thermoplasmatales archaeon]|nr:type II toxin-antitoxin system RelE/ParE family toxin [Candidatus Thermoplasmatota archaeon]MCG2825718.1 type II toxin-antitoxin system RelE/ParE family toxin [Thermoplasmatales archaeon]